MVCLKEALFVKTFFMNRRTGEAENRGIGECFYSVSPILPVSGSLRAEEQTVFINRFSFHLLIF
jgi:hypothetical protein